MKALSIIIENLSHKTFNAANKILINCVTIT